MTGDFEFPAMRAEVKEALRALSDPEHQHARWGRYEPGVEYYDDLDLNVHILYDDTQVLPEPASAVPSLLHESEAPALLALDAVLGEMIRQLGDAPDTSYVSDPRWPAVVRAAGEALRVMNANDDEGPST
jgi:hypothetical protein